MMNESLDRMYELLPAVYRMRDAEQGYPLRALMQLIAGQANVIQSYIRQLYDNWFIETCQDWVVPYLGDLLGYRPVNPAGDPGTVNLKILSPRREVANLIRFRRRKGTLALLEQLAHDLTGWPAHAVEFYRRLAVTQSLNYLRPDNGGTIDLRHMPELARLDGPFDQSAHLVEVRRINSALHQGRYNIPSVGLFLWRLKSYPLTFTEAYCLNQKPNLYTFSVLSNDAPLFTAPQPEIEGDSVSAELSLPVPIERDSLEQHLKDYYGPGKSFQIWRGVQKGRNTPVTREAVLPEEIVVADLTDWKYQPPQSSRKVFVDPVLGRLAFTPGPANQRPTGVWVSYHYGFSADLGGGEYRRPISQPQEADFFEVSSSSPGIQAAFEKWSKSDKALPQAVIEITDSGVYTERLDLNLKAGQSLQIRAANGKRPVIRLLDQRVNQPDPIRVDGESGSRFTLDGIMVTGQGMSVTGQLAELSIRHCTLVPGWGLHHDCEPRFPAEMSLELATVGTCVNIEHSIIGSIVVNLNMVTDEPLPLRLSDSILDATGSDLPALLSSDGENIPAHAALTVLRSTIIGSVYAHRLPLAENSIFDGQLRVARRQQGCVRFCYVWSGSRTPRRYNCQPDLVERAVAESFLAGDQSEEKQQLIESEAMRVKPRFNSLRYGRPNYCQLAQTCAPEIRRGADDESEMGVFHDLFQPQREANLLARLEEFSPTGTDAGLIFVN